MDDGHGPAPGCLPKLETVPQLQPDITQATAAVLMLQKTEIMFEPDDIEDIDSF